MTLSPDSGTRPRPLGRLAGKRALVVGGGGAGNIGQAIARAFAAEGANLIIAGRTLASVQAIAAEIGGVAAQCDITDAASIERLFACADGPIDIAVNSAGRSLFRSFMETTAGDMEELCAIHIIGPLLFTQAAVHAMPKGGSIIHISSLTARLVMPDHVAYMATKAAGEVVVRAAAFEFGARGIRVNAIAPALTRTPMTDAFFADPNLAAASAQASPLRRLGTVEDVANAAVWLASDDCFMTGEIVQVNGGMAMHTLPLAVL